MSKTLFLVTPVLLRNVNGRLGLDEQTCEGLIRWAENFEQITFACMVLPEHVRQVNSETWRAIDDLPCRDRIEFLLLPYAYRLPDFLRTYRQTQQILRSKIHESQYLCFHLCVLIGDWGGIACLEAMQLNRPYAVWTDRVEYEVIWRTLSNQRLKRRLKELLTLPIMKLYLKYLIQRSRLGLFQGQECYEEFSQFSRNAHCVYDVHTQKEDQIDLCMLRTKIDQLVRGQPLKIAYVGRAAEMKGAIDWVRVIHHICEAGVRVEATWLGDGELLPQMKQLAEDLGICDRIRFEGFVGDRQKILETLRQQHLFVFCHKTPESPRCLVEALVSGCPIVGYDSPYPKGLVANHGGGQFSPVDDDTALANLIVQLDADRPKLCYLIQEAARTGRAFDEETVFHHRTSLIKEHLPAKPGSVVSTISYSR
ncbi:glycosyltransferase [Myxacorys almedinensis]|uniref:Glycosyltransferase n=1 Tax=Myxacorys almedinensis A TaxID=2690445 RepID=A0A8J8CGT4_9CYAN|nr:glycosyltransferase [Myxacorys almedinensis]NDJ16068.1 glycosyltransferase [Myxacorys almedinensis A]